MSHALGKLDISTPIYCAESMVTYHVVRKPTVFEGLILKLSREHRDQLGAHSLNQIAETLKIEDVFLEQALDSLFDNDMLEERLKLSHRVSDILLTRSGENLYRKNEMPSTRKNAPVHLYYDPLSERLLEKDKYWREGEDESFDRISEEVLSVSVDHIRAISETYINNGTEKTLSWKQSNINISDIHTEIKGVLWRSIPVNITIDKNGNLLHECLGKSDAAQNFDEWLKKASPEILWDSFLSNYFNKGPQYHESLQNFDWQKIVKVALPADKIDISRSKLQVRSIDIEASNVPMAKYSLVLSNKASAIHLDDKTQTLTVPCECQMNVRGLNALYLDENNNSTLLYRGQYTIYYAKQPRIVSLQLQIQDEDLWGAIRQKVMTNIDAETNIAKKLDALAFSSIFLTIEEVLQCMPIVNVNTMRNFRITLEGYIGKTAISKQWVDKIDLLETVQDINISKQILPQFTVEKNNLSDKLQGELIDLSLEGRFYGTALDQALKALEQVNKELKSCFNFDDFKTMKAAKKTIDNKKLSVKVMNVVNQWLAVFEDIATKFADVLHCCNKAQTQRDNLMLWQQLVETSFAPKRADGKQVAVLDTSYLMNHNDHVNTIAQTRHIIIPHIVLNELDGLKGGNNDEQTEKIKKARAAISLLHSNTLEYSVEQCEEKLLHWVNQKDQDFTNDEKILTVALHHRLNNAVLYSADKGLCVLAKSAGILFEEK